MIPGKTLAQRCLLAHRRAHGRRQHKFYLEACYYTRIDAT